METILKFTKNITALDVSEEALKFCKTRYKNNKIKFIRGDVHELPFEGNKFDLAICTEVIEYVYFPIKVIKEIKRVLKDRSYLILSSQNYLNA